MTLLIWAATQDFALVVADRRGIVIGAQASPLAGLFEDLGDGTYQTDLMAKANVSPDGRDLFAMAGVASVSGPAFGAAKGLHGIEADQAIGRHLENSANLRSAHLDSALQQPAHSLLHGYAHDGKLVCSRFEWSGVHRQWQVQTGRADGIPIVACGSGATYVYSIVSNPAEHAQWMALRENATVEQLRQKLVRLVAAVSSLDAYVSRETMAWILKASDGVWQQLDEAAHEEPTTATPEGMAPLEEGGTIAEAITGDREPPAL